MLNHIEFNVTGASSYIEKAKQETEMAVVLNKKVRKVRVCLSLVFTLGVVDTNACV